jgi:hypothetical protein
MTKQEYTDAKRCFDIEAMKLDQNRCDLDVKQCSLNIDKELLLKQSVHLDKRRLDLEMKYTQSKIDGQTGYEDDYEEDAA